MREYKKVVYVSHPSSGLPVNERRIAETIKILVKEYPDILFVSPVHCFGFLYNELPWDEGMSQCIGLLNLCDEVWVFGDWQESTGCLYEVQYCKLHKIPYKIIPDGICEKSDTIDYLNPECLEKCAFCECDDEGLYCQIAELHMRTRHAERHK